MTTRILNCRPSGKSDRDFKLTEDTIPVISVGNGLLPQNRRIEKGSRLSVYDQGNTGACVGYAVTLAVQAYDAYALRVSRLIDPILLWMNSKEMDEFRSGPTVMLPLEGTSIRACLGVLKKYGASGNSHLNYDYEGWARLAALNRIRSYAVVEFSQLSKALELGPVILCIRPDKKFFDGVDTVDRAAPVNNKGIHQYHAVVVLYEHKVGSKTYYKIHNSWGGDWGKYGQMNASKEYLKSIFVEGWTIS